METIIESLDLTSFPRVMRQVLSEKDAGQHWFFWNIGRRDDNDQMFAWSTDSPSKGTKHERLPLNWTLT